MGAVQNATRREAKDTALLGESNSVVRNRLSRIIQFDMLQRFNLDTCYRCGRKIERVEELSVEHKQPWRSAADPKASFFDLDNVAWSHRRCNSRAANHEKTHCKRGHPFDKANTIIAPSGKRKCRLCDEDYRKRNHELIAQVNQRYRDNNKERIAQRGKRFRTNNKEALIQKGQRYRAKNKERIKQKRKERYHRNKGM